MNGSQRVPRGRHSLIGGICWVLLLVYPLLQGCTTTTVTLVKLGDGRGIVSGIPGGAPCGADCPGLVSQSVSGSAQSNTVTLTATPDIGSSVFTGWSGPCTNLGAAAFPPHTTVCQFDMTASRTVYAAFLATPPPSSPNVFRNVTVNKLGRGTVTASPGQAGACGTNCVTLPQGVPVTFTATPEAGFAFTSWTGCNVVVGVDCTILVNGDGTVIATFTGLTTLSIKLSSPDGGGGKVSAFPEGTPPLVCDASNGLGDQDVLCSTSFPIGQSFTLTAVVNPLSAFRNWENCPGTVNPPDPAPESTFSSTCSGVVGPATPPVIKAVFAGTFPLKITKGGSGKGSVKAWVTGSNGLLPANPVGPPDIDCGWTCQTQTAHFRHVDRVGILAVGAPLNHQSGWGGACHDTVGDICYVDIGRASTEVSVNFSPL